MSDFSKGPSLKCPMAYTGPLQRSPDCNFRVENLGCCQDWALTAWLLVLCCLNHTRASWAMIWSHILINFLDLGIFESVDLHSEEQVSDNSAKGLSNENSFIRGTGLGFQMWVTSTLYSVTNLTSSVGAFDHYRTFSGIYEIRTNYCIRI